MYKRQGAWVAIATSVLLLSIFMKRWYVPLILAAIVGLCLPFLPLKRALINRAASVVTLPRSIKTDVSLSSRVKYYETAFELIKEKPLHGWGYGRKMPRKIRKKLGEKWFREKGLKPFKSHCHNSYLELTLESGFLGLVAFLAFLYALFYKGWKVYIGSSNPRAKLTALGIMGGMLALMIHGLVDNIFQKPYISYMFLFMGFICSLERSHEDQSP